MHRIRNVCSAIAALCVFAVSQQQAHAGDLAQLRTFDVNATSDGTDAVPGDGICDIDTNPDTPPKCTLRAAIMEGNTMDDNWIVEVMLVPDNTYSLTMPGSQEDASATGDLDVLRPMRIGIPDGAWPKASIDVQVQGQDRAIHFREAADQSKLYGLRIVGGEYVQGAAIHTNVSLTIDMCEISENAIVDGGSVLRISHGKSILRNSRVHANESLDPEPGDAAVYIASGAELLVERSLVDANEGSGIRVASGALLTMMGSTVSGNYGLGLWIIGAANVRSSTLVNNELNSALDQSQIFMHEQGAKLELKNSIVSGGSIDCDIQENAPDVLFTAEYNIYGDGSCTSDTLSDNSVHQADPELSETLLELGYWGGPTPTHMLLPGSIAIDYAPASLCADDGTDQRGMPRPVSYEANEEPRCDAGAVEVQMPWLFADGFEGDG